MSTNSESSATAPETMHTKTSNRGNNKTIWFIIAVIVAFVGLCLCGTIFGVVILLNPVANPISPGSAKPSHYGVYLKQGGTLVELPVAYSPPKGNWIETSDTRPTIVFWQRNVNLDLLDWSGDTRETGRFDSDVPYNSTPRENGILELVPKQTLKAGNYCLAREYHGSPW